MRNWILQLKRLATEENGASAIEYAVIAGVVAVGLIAALGGLTDGLDATFGKIIEAISNPTQT